MNRNIVILRIIMTDVSVNIFHIALTMKHHTDDLKYGSKSTRRRGLNIKDIFFTIMASCVCIYKQTNARYYFLQ